MGRAYLEYADENINSIRAKGRRKKDRCNITKPLEYEGRTESHEQHFFACELGTADEGECGGR